MLPLAPLPLADLPRRRIGSGPVAPLQGRDPGTDDPDQGEGDQDGRASLWSRQETRSHHGIIPPSIRIGPLIWFTSEPSRPMLWPIPWVVTTRAGRLRAMVEVS